MNADNREIGIFGPGLHTSGFTSGFISGRLLI